MSKEARTGIERLAEILLRIDQLAVTAQEVSSQSRRLALEASSIVGLLLGKDLGLLGAGLYMVVENGNQRIVNDNQVARIKSTWHGEFLLDLPKQEIHIRKNRQTRSINFAAEGIHWGIQRVLVIGMCKPGIPFGFHTFSKRDPEGSGIGNVETLTRYVKDLRLVIGDIGKKSRYLHKTRVELTVSPTRWGYVFDRRWKYLVIASYDEEVIKNF